MRRRIFIIIVSLIFVLNNSNFVYGHGAEIEYTKSTAYKITAEFDSGKPMSNAQIIIYAPDNPKEPWEVGKSNEEGVYLFTPDTSKKGQWFIQARLASHGASINIDIDESTLVSDTSGYSNGQMILMLASLVWGCIGTALYFKNGYRKKDKDINGV